MVPLLGRRQQYITVARIIINIITGIKNHTKRTGFEKFCFPDSPSISSELGAVKNEKTLIWIAFEAFKLQKCCFLRLFLDLDS